MEQIIFRDDYGCKRYEAQFGEGVLRVFAYTVRRALGELETIEFCKDYAKPLLGALNKQLVDDEVSRPELTLR